MSYLPALVTTAEGAVIVYKNDIGAVRDYYDGKAYSRQDEEGGE